MSLSVRDSDPSRRHFVITLAGVPRLIELWAFEHLPWLAPRKGQRPLEFPAGRRWGWKKKLTVRPPPDTVWDLIRDGNPERLLDAPGPTMRVPRAGDTVVREGGHGTRPYGIAVPTRG
ncbi:uncharacterized protein [Spinacia oleracea]|uniref:Uncharacterized protein n=1 Tax=Spinacia oleracea TaxID=3562 RepID=A0ABM3QYU2_SPIOL|nr:uncharacterized protein LOC130463391 [Spinacia oleracea]